MNDKELISFVEWLMKSEESPKDSSFEETVAWINDLSRSEQGREILTKLTNTYKNSDMKIFKDGGKLKHLLCLKNGGKGPDCGCNKGTKPQYDTFDTYQKGRLIEKAENGTNIGLATYKIKKGDNLIKIARQFGLNSLDEILALNPHIKNPNLIYVGQILNLPKDKMTQNGKLDKSVVSAKMPNYDRVAYAELPTSVKAKVDAYAQAIRDHKMKYTDVPVLYRQQAYNQSIRQATGEAAPLVATKVLMAPWTIPDTVIRGGLNEVRKAINGKDDSGDYGIGNYFDGNFSWLGKEFQEKYPVADLVINAATTPVVMVGAENLAARAMDGTLEGALARASANAKATARTMGVQPEPITVETTMGRSGGHSYKGPGSGKAHTTGSVNNASYRQVPVSSKTVDPMQFVENPPASGFVGTGYWHGFPVVLPEQERPKYVVVEPEKEHTEETIVSKNPWIYNTNRPDVVIPYAPGYETITYTVGQANRGNSPREQVITKESIETGKGNPKPGVKVKKGEAVGSTPSGYHSGYGYTYGSEGGPWLLYQKNGGIINKRKK